MGRAQILTPVIEPELDRAEDSKKERKEKKYQTTLP